MGLLDNIFDKDKDDAKAKPAPKPAPAPAARADFSDVRGASETTASASAGASRSYTVVAGDSLSKIAQRELGDGSRWRAIYDANRDKIDDPDLIHPGQVLKIPANS
jgi:nucleoid-associated protein YgaU